MERLMAYLRELPAGEVADTTELERRLAECWDQFQGDCRGMEAYKLLGRMDNVLWYPPILSFTIERHGGTAMGSTRAELQHWQVDLERKIVAERVHRYRQVHERAPRWNAEAVAEEIVQIVLNRGEDSRLKWSQDGRVHVLIETMLTGGYRQTEQGRRVRLRNAVRKRLTAQGWKDEGRNRYSPPVRTT